MRNALPKDTTPAPAPAPNPDPSGQGDNPAEPANPNPAGQTDPSEQGNNPANPANPNPADSDELKPTEPTGSDQQKPEGDQKHGKYGAPNTGYEF